MFFHIKLQSNEKEYCLAENSVGAVIIWIYEKNIQHFLWTITSRFLKKLYFQVLQIKKKKYCICSQHLAHFHLVDGARVGRATFLCNDTILDTNYNHHTTGAAVAACTINQVCTYLKIIQLNIRPIYSWCISTVSSIILLFFNIC